MNSISKPFLLSPAAKDYLWGGRRLNDEFAKNIDLSPLAETWECSTHPDGVSVVSSGELKGETLDKVILAHPEFLGSHPLENCKDGHPELPIMIKLIDASKDLSVQVHPDDEYAFKNENGQRGKTEMWYVLDADKHASLVYGLQLDADPDRLKSAIKTGEIEKYLRNVSVKKDDVFFIKPGTIHAIGAGILVAEIQESSNLTYRLYDYDRIDKNGQKRELHIDKALEVSSLKASRAPKQPMRILNYKKGLATELVGRCKYFEVHRTILNTERTKDMVTYTPDDTSFRVFLCVTGCGTLIYDDGDTLPFFKGDCIFVPATSAPFKLHGKAQLLDVRG